MVEKSPISPLIGAIAGDIIGSVYEFEGCKDGKVQFFADGCRFTDDTVLTLAVANWLTTPQMPLSEMLASYAHNNPTAGYGGMFWRWCHFIDKAPYNSYGNGSAMRVSPVGCFASTIEEAMELAEESAAVTHNHPEGIKGAQATAVAIVMAKNGADKKEIKEKLEELFDYDISRTYEELRKEPYVFDVTCQGTVPKALMCFLDSDSYEDCIAMAILTNKDCDTAAAIAGAVAGAYYGVPEEFKEKVFEMIPRGTIERFEKMLKRKKESI